MGWARKNLGIELNPFRVLDSALNKVGEVIGAILHNPLPALMQIGGAMIGIPPYVTAAAVTAVQGGDIEDIAKSVAISYVTSDFLQNTQIGADIRNYTSNLIAGDVTDYMIENFDISMDQAVTVAKMTTAAVNGAVVGGIRSTLLGDSIATGMAQGFSQGLVYSGVDSYFDDLNKDPNWGISPRALNLVKGATSTALNTLISGEGDPGAAIGNYLAYATLKIGASEVKDALKRAYDEYTGKTDQAKAAQDVFINKKTAYDAEVRRHDSIADEIRQQASAYEDIVNNQLAPIRSQLEKEQAEVQMQQTFQKDAIKVFEENKWAYENYDAKLRSLGYEEQWVMDGEGASYSSMGYAKIVGYKKQWHTVQDGEGSREEQIDVPIWDWNAPSQQSFAAAANAAAAEANKYGELAQAAADRYQAVAESQQTQNILTQLEAIKTEIGQKTETLNTIRQNIETPQNGNLAEQLKVAAETYDKKYADYKKSEEAAQRASENYNRIMAEVVVRDATIDAINAGAIMVTGRNEDGSFTLDNGFTVKDGKFFQNGEQLFTNAAGLSQNVLELATPDGQVTRFGMDAGRQLSTTDVQNIFKRDYGLDVSLDEARRFAGTAFDKVENTKLQDFAIDKISQEFKSLTNKDLSAEQAKELLVQQDSMKAAQERAIIESDIYIPPEYENDEARYLKAAAQAQREGKERFTYVNSEGQEVQVFLETFAQRAAAEERALIEQTTRNATGEFDNKDISYVKATLGDAIRMANTTGKFDDLNPADFKEEEMNQAIDIFVQSTPEERAKLLMGSDGATFTVINDMLQQRVGSTEKTSGTVYSNPNSKDTITESNLTNYRGVLETGLRGAASDITRLVTRAGQVIGDAVGLDTNALDKLQTMLRDDQKKRMDQLVGDERVIAAGIGSGITSGVSWALGGPVGGIATLAGISANNSWMDGAEAVIDSKGNAWESEEEARKNGVFDYRKLTPAENAQRTAMMTSLEITGEILGAPAMKIIMAGIPISANPAVMIAAAGRLALAFGGEHLAEALTTSMQMAVDKMATFGLGQNATFGEWIDALRDTALATTVAVGGAGAIGTVSNQLRQTALNRNPFSEDTRETMDMRSVISLNDAIKDAGVDQAQLAEMERQIQEIINRDRTAAPQVIADTAQVLTDAGMNQLRANVIANELVVRNLELDLTTKLTDNGFSPEDIAPVITQFRENLTKNTDPEKTLGEKAFDSVYEIFTDPQVFESLYPQQNVTPQDADKALKDAGISNPTPEQIEQLVGKKPETELITQAGQIADPLVVTTEEARQALVNAGISNPTPEQIEQVVGEYDQSKVGEKAAPVADQGLVTAEEARAALVAAGISNPTQQQIDQLVGEYNQAELAGRAAPIADPLVVTQEEARQALVNAGITNPTAEQIQQLVGEYSQSELAGRAAPIADPVVVTPAEAREALIAAGISSPTEAQIAQLIGEYNQSELAGRAAPIADPLVVTPEEARQALINAGVTEPTAEQIQQFVGERAQSELGGAVQTFADTLPATRGTVRETQEQIQEMGSVLMQQYDALSAAQKAQFDALVEQGANMQTAMNTIQADITTELQNVENRLSSAVAANEAAGLSRDEALTKAVEDVAANIGLTKDDLLARMGESEASLREQFAAGQEQTQQQIADLDASTQAKFEQLSDAQKEQALQLAQTSGDLTAAINNVAESIGAQIGDVETRLKDAMAANEAAGLSRDEAAAKAIEDVAASVGATKTDLLSQLGKTEETIRGELAAGLQATQEQLSQEMQAQYQQLTEAQKAEVDARVQQGQDLTAAITAVGAQISSQITQTETALRDAIGQLGTDVQGRFDEMSEAQKAEVFARVQQGQDLSAAIQNVSIQTSEQIAASEAAMKQAIEQLGTDVQGQFNQMSEAQKAEVAARVQQGQDLNAAIQNVSQQTTEQIAQTEASLQAAIGQLGSDVQGRFDEMSEAQKAEVAARVQQGQDLRTAIDNVGTQTAQQIAASEAAMREALGQLGTDVQTQFSQMSAAQQAEVAARVQQGQDLQSAITNVGQQTAQQIAQSETALRGQISSLGEDMQKQFDSMSEAQQAEVAARVQQGEDLNTAINSVSFEVTELGEKLTTDVQDIRKTMEEENQRRIAAERFAAGKAQQEKLIQKAQQNIAVPGAGGVEGAGAPTPSPQFRQALTTGEGQEAKFEGPLEEFLKKVETTSYTQPAGQPMQQPQQQVTQQPQATQMAQQQGPNYYSYGVFNEIDSILNPLQNIMPTMFAKEGGLAAPLMARGGLNVVHHAGKQRLDFRQGAAVSGPGDGQSDDIPAMLADGEFVFPADVVAALGNGSTKAGSDKLYDMMHSIRAYHRSAKPQDLPPPAKKSPLDYLKKARR